MDAPQAPTPNDLAQLKPIFRFHRNSNHASSLAQDAPLEALPAHWIREITGLRKENAKTRIDLRDTRQELAEAQQRIAALMLDLADLRAGIPAR
jgi:hypothetical protein